MSDKTKEERIVDYVTSIAALDDAMKPYKEQKGDLRKSYLDNKWLSKDEIKNFAKLYGFYRITCECPVGQTSKRRDINEIIEQLQLHFHLRLLRVKLLHLHQSMHFSLYVHVQLLKSVCFQVKWGALLKVDLL